VNAFLSSPEPSEPNSDVRLFETRSYEPIPVTIEPWGIPLYPIPEYSYVVDVHEGRNFRKDQLEGRTRAVGGYEARVISDPITLWLSASDRHTIHRHGGAVSGLVWESTRPSEIASLLTDQRLARLLQEAADLQAARQTVFEHQFAAMVTPLAKETGHHDLVLLLREHGVVQKKGGTIVLTEWGRQVAIMYSAKDESR